MGALDPVKKYPGIMKGSPNGGVVIQGGDERPKFADIYMFELFILHAIRYMAMINEY
jgi:hypothetical protein